MQEELLLDGSHESNMSERKCSRWVKKNRVDLFGIYLGMMNELR